MPLEAIRRSLVSLIKQRAIQVAELEKLSVWASNGVIERMLWKAINSYDKERIRWKFYQRMFLNSDD